MPVEDAVIVNRLRALLKEVDMATTTERKLRQTLEAELEEDLSERKALIRKEVQAYLERQHQAEGGAEERGNGEGTAGQDANGAPDEEEPEEQAEEKPKKKRRAASAFGSILSEPMQEFLGKESMPRTEVVKWLWAYIKKHGLQNPKNKRKILMDDALAKLFKPPLDMFSMNKQLSRHVFAGDRHDKPEEEDDDEEEADSEDDEDEDEDDDRAPPKKKVARTPAAKRPARRKASQEAGEGGKPPKKRRASSSGDSGGCELSPEMQKFLGGVPRMPRPHVVKAVWAYVKEHNLQDPTDKRSFLPDAKLATILTPPVNMFNMNKQLSKHVFSASKS